jgi:hypothetical protein
MADSDRKPVFLHAFRSYPPLSLRCNGKLPPPPTIEECVLYAGHVGVSFTRRGPIYGFLPDTGETPPLEVVRSLKNGGVYPGKVSDDTHLFEAAAAASIQVVTVEYSYDIQTAVGIENVVLNELASTSLTYSFPGHQGDCNCVTWLARMGLRMPETTGRMTLLVQALLAEKATEPVVV